MRQVLLQITLLAWVFCAVAQTPDIVVQTGHGINPTVVVFSSDGKLLATGGKDKQIKIWDVESGQLIRTINTYDAVNDLAFFPNNNKYIFSVSAGKNTGYPLYIWDTETGGYSDKHEVEGGLKNIILTLNGELLVTPGIRGPLEYWIPGSEEGVYDFYQTVGAEWVSFKDIVVAMNASLTQLMFITTVYDTQYVAASVPMGDTTLGSELNYQLILNYPMRKLLFTGDEQYLIGLGGKNENSLKIMVLNARGQNIEQEFDATQYCLEDRSKSIIYIDYAGAIKNFSLPEMKTSQTLVNDGQKYVIVAASPTGDRFAALDLEGNMRVWEYPSGKPMNEIRKIPPRQNVLFDPQGRFVMFDGDDGQLVKWEMETGTIEITRPHHEAIEHIEMSADGEWLATAGRDSTIKLFHLPENKLYREIKLSTPHINSIDLTATGSYMSVAYLDSFFNFYVDSNQILEKVGIGEELNYYGIGSGDTIFYYLTRGQHFYVYDSDTQIVALDYGSKVDRPLMSPDNKYFVFTAPGDTFELFRTDDFLHYTPYNHGHESLTSVAFSPDSRYLFCGQGTGYINVLDVQEGKFEGQLSGHKDAVRSMSYYAAKNMLASSGNDGTIILWDLNTMKSIATLYAFSDGTWAVVDAEGRYDASNAGVIEHMHFVSGMEIIDLYQLKERYYEPGLLQKLLGYNDEPVRDVAVFDKLALYPEVVPSLKTTPELTLHLELVKRDGGYGRVQVFINDKEVIEDAARGKINERLDTASLDIPLKGFSQFIMGGVENKIGVKVFNKEGYLSSRYHTLAYKPEKVALNISKTPHLYALVAGTSNYRGEKLDLKFADEDAKDMAEALTASGSVLLGKMNVHVKLLNTATQTAESLPTKENIKKTLDEFALKATPADIVLIYFSGHGVSYGDAEGMFYYLTSGMESGDLKDEAIRQQYTISTSELTDWLKKIPAQKQVMIIDACSSGKLVEDILAMKAVPSNQIRAIERMKERTGTFIIAGSASDMVSYEASQFGQSLLTYSLLLGMSGAALRENEFVDVMTLFQYSADKVPVFAKYIGGIQKPVVFAPFESNSFDIGRVTREVHIPIANVKPLFVRSNFQQEDFPYDDVLALSEKINAQFNEMTSKGKDSPVIFVDAKPYPNSYFITGRYSIASGKVTLKGGLIKVDETGASKPVGQPFTVERPEQEAALLADDILLKVQELVK